MTVPSGKINYAGQPLASIHNPHQIQLKSGQSWLIPSGNYIFELPGQTVIQWFDYPSGLWRVLSSSGYSAAPYVIQSDGTNYRLLNTSGTLQGVDITAGGSLYTQATTTITVGAPSAPGVTAAVTPIIGGSLTFAVTTGGTGYINPWITIDTPEINGGVQGMCIGATATLTISAGVITGITTGFAGAGYVNAPNYTINDVPGGGSGAVITPTVVGSGTAGALTGALVTNPGSGYTGATLPTLTVVAGSGGGSGATATALMNYCLSSVTVAGTNTGYSGTPIAQSSLGIVQQLVMGEEVQPRPARVTFGLSAGIINSQVIEDAGSGFQSVPAMAQFVNAGSNATLTAVVGSRTNTVVYYEVG